MKIVAQLIDKKSGRRTAPVTKTRTDFANTLREFFTGKPDDAYVLILADDSHEPGNFEFALAPLMTVGTFIEHFAMKADLLDTAIQQLEDHNLKADLAAQKGK